MAHHNEGLRLLRRLAWGALGFGAALCAAWLWLTHRGVVVSAQRPIPECSTPLAPEIEALVRPVLVESQAWESDPNDDALHALLTDKSPQALEARVALGAYSLGAHPGEELAESLLSQEAEATPLMRHYMQCRPPLAREWLIGTVRAGRGGYEAYFELLKERRLTTR